MIAHSSLRQFVISAILWNCCSLVKGGARRDKKMDFVVMLTFAFGAKREKKPRGECVRLEAARGRAVPLD